MTSTINVKGLLKWRYLLFFSFPSSVSNHLRLRYLQWFFDRINLFTLVILIWSLLSWSVINWMGNLQWYPVSSFAMFHSGISFLLPSKRDLDVNTRSSFSDIASTFHRWLLMHEGGVLTEMIRWRVNGMDCVRRITELAVSRVWLSRGSVVKIMRSMERG